MSSRHTTVFKLAVISKDFYDPFLCDVSECSHLLQIFRIDPTGSVIIFIMLMRHYLYYYRDVHMQYSFSFLSILGIELYICSPIRAILCLRFRSREIGG